MDLTISSALYNLSLFADGLEKFAFSKSSASSGLLRIYVSKCFKGKFNGRENC